MERDLFDHLADTLQLSGSPTWNQFKQFEELWVNHMLDEGLLKQNATSKQWELTSDTKLKDAQLLKEHWEKQHADAQRQINYALQPPRQQVSPFACTHLV
jgi:hypothetical protein